MGRAIARDLQLTGGNAGRLVTRLETGPTGRKVICLWPSAQASNRGCLKERRAHRPLYRPEHRAFLAETNLDLCRVDIDVNVFRRHLDEKEGQRVPANRQQGVICLHDRKR